MSTRITRKLMLSLSAVVVLAAGAFFQNCSKIGFNASSDSLRSLSDGLVTNAQTNLNTPVDVSLRHAGTYSSVNLNVATNDGNGTYQVLDANAVKITFTPNYGFRGDAHASFTVSDKYGASETLELITSVGNGISALKPALAVRGMGCVQCHAQVASNVLTDFGYGDPYYFTGGSSPNFSWNSGSLYGDHSRAFGTINLQGNQIIVPRAPLPAVVSSAVPGTSTIANYLSNTFGGAPTGTITEVSSVFIGAPSALQIETGLRLAPGERIKFYVNDNTSPQMTGLLDKGTYVRNDPNAALVCDGDVAIRGPLLLDNLKLNTTNGCRLYVIGSVFVYGTVTYVNENPNRNLQISSSRTVAMGIGQIYKNGVVCEPGDRYDRAAAGYDGNNYDPDVLLTRYVKFFTVPSQMTRESNDAKALGQAVLNDRNLIQAGEGILYDASCRPETRATGFDRLLVNAPSVHSRYQGNFDGTVIAEYAIMSLQSFKFQFDAVFSNQQVPVLPFLPRSQYLSVTQ